MKKNKLMIAIVIILVVIGSIVFIKRELLFDSTTPTQSDTMQRDTPIVTDATVYMTTNLSSEGLVNIYNVLEYEPMGDVAVKVSTGEPGGNYYLQPDLIKDLVQLVDGTIVESNTAYGGSRANTAMHKQVAEDHGFTAIADVDILDEDGEISLPVTFGRNLSENLVGSHFSEYRSYIALSHFKGHSMAGFGGAIKNASIGIASSNGKSLIHSAGDSTSSPWGGEQDPFLESMAEANKTVSDSLEGQIIYINVLNNLSVDCDCSSNPAEPDMHDIGILASTDPVALDQASVDLIYNSEEGTSLVNRIESRNGTHVLDYGEEIGLGTKKYTIVNIDG